MPHRHDTSNTTQQKTLIANTAARLIAESGISVTAFQMFFFAGFALLAALAFGWYARRYKVVDNYRAV